MRFWRVYPLLWAVALLLVTAGCGDRQVSVPTPQMNAEEEFWVRVLLEKDLRRCILHIGSGFSVINPATEDGERIFGAGSAPIEVRMTAGRIIVASESYDWQEVVISPEEPCIFELNGRSYRGKLKLVVNPAGESFDAINILPIEPYLAGVVGAEMPQYWEPAALEAQTIAARTYCLYIKDRFGGGRNWDVRRTQANQVYLGLGGESAQIWSVVDSTCGRVLMCEQADGSKGIFPSYYSSVCGGHTEDSSNVFGDSFEPLRGSVCDYCKEVARPGFFFWPMVKVAKSVVTERLFARYPRLRELGDVKDIVAARVSDYGTFRRITSFKLVGSNGKTGFLRAEDLRLCIDPSGARIRSTSFELADMGSEWAFLSGRGYGHSVGMCQCGAQGLARRGKSAEEILEYYYPGAEIVSLY